MTKLHIQSQALINRNYKKRKEIKKVDRHPPIIFSCLDNSPKTHEQK